MNHPYDLWIEAEHWAPGEWIPENTNSDVRVTFPDGRIYTATFFTLSNVDALRARHRETGECLGGRYFWSTNMILVDEVSRTRIEQVVTDLMASREFESAFDGPHEPAV